MRFFSIFLSLFCLSISNVFACSNNEPELISLNFLESTDPNFLDLHISLPKFYEGERLSSLNLLGSNKLGKASAWIPLGYEVENDTASTILSMLPTDYENWEVVAMYLKLPQTKIENGKKVSYVQLDGCILEARKKLKHNKVKNENASKAGTDAAKTRRPF